MCNAACLQEDKVERSVMLLGSRGGFILVVAEHVSTAFKGWMCHSRPPLGSLSTILSCLSLRPRPYTWHLLSGVKALTVASSPLESCAKTLVSVKTQWPVFQKGPLWGAEQVSHHMSPSKSCSFARKPGWRMLIESLFHWRRLCFLPKFSQHIVQIHSLCFIQV